MILNKFSDPKKLSIFSFNNNEKSCSSKNEPKASATNCVQISSKRDDLYYNMDNKCHGRCIILNYEQFDSQELTRRRGTESDVTKLSHTFAKLNFHVEMFNDLTQHKTFEIFKRGNFIWIL